MHITHLHDWNISASEAIALQKQMTAQIDYHHPIDIRSVKTVAGVDVSVKPDPATGKDMSQAAVVVLSFPDMQVIETSLATMPTPFPYIPGLLSFREGPVLEIAFQKLQTEPDVLIFDGMGRAHPRRIGIASHMGLWLQKPTIGCGKTLFVGHFQEPGNERGDFSNLIDKDEVIGGVLRTRPNVKPVFISVGHLADLPTALKFVMLCTSKYRLPDPIRAAHNAAGEMKFE
ncbi:MAG TPA: deoxyribonuclease V [Phototrophicaceae bacterium]|nr:deoxyribonuclease V [Phototrophicaceae bacterium]